MYRVLVATVLVVLLCSAGVSADQHELECELPQPLDSITYGEVNQQYLDVQGFDRVPSRVPVGEVVVLQIQLQNRASLQTIWAADVATVPAGGGLGRRNVSVSACGSDTARVPFVGLRTGNYTLAIDGQATNRTIAVVEPTPTPSPTATATQTPADEIGLEKVERTTPASGPGFGPIVALLSIMVILARR